MELSIIIPTKDRAAIFNITIKHALNAIANMDAEIIVVNDGGETSQLKILDENRVRLTNNDGSGVAAARNHGFSLAKSGLLLFLDDDILIDEVSLKRAVNIKRQFSEHVFNFNWHYPTDLLNNISKTKFGRFLISQDLTTMKGWSKDPAWKDDEPFHCSAIAGATLMINREHYRNVDGYDASYPFAGAEDFDFNARLKSAGYGTMVDPRVLFFHNEMNKTSLRGWCARSERAAITRKHAVNQGYKEMELNIDSSKQKIFRTARYFKSVLFFLTDILPNVSLFDSTYNKLAHLLIGIHLIKGYENYAPSH